MEKKERKMFRITDEEKKNFVDKNHSEDINQHMNIHNSRVKPFSTVNTNTTNNEND